MTTMRDWLFRAESLRMQARHMDERAEQLKTEAQHYRNLASSAQAIADEFVSDAIDNLEDTIDRVQS
jgi:hypothetical protein